MDKTLLGVDVALNGRLVAADANEAELLRLTQDTPAKIVVGVIGGQGLHIRARQSAIERAADTAGGRAQYHRGGDAAQTPGAGRQAAAGSTPATARWTMRLSGYIGVVTGLRETHTYRVAF